MTRKMNRPICALVLLAGVASMTGIASAQALNAGGATFPFPMYSKWFDEYHKKVPSVSVNYQSIGSGGGVQQVTAGTLDFGASDYSLTDAQLKEFRDKRGFDVLAFPTVLGADVPAYKIPGVTATLNFTPEALAGIFLGKITKWNDPELTKANPGVNLPAQNIVVVHRSDGSGTTFIWVDYLCKVSKDWEKGPGRGASVNWPVGLGGKGNEGVAGLVLQTPNSIGYVELTYALQTKMSFGNVKNAAGVFVKADLASVTAAAASMVKEIPDDFRVSITNASGKGAFPVTSFTWLLVPEKIADPGKKKAIKDFLTWMLTDGQNMTEELSYAKLPAAVVANEKKAIAKIQ
jgi:phosphate transport system substrate-binding protein